MFVIKLYDVLIIDVCFVFREDSDISFVAAKVATPKTGSKKTDK